MVKTKTKKYRGHGTHGRGRKHGRGKGLRGGKGNAGLHKHKYASTVILEKQGVLVFGQRGFKRPTGTVFADVVINVGELAERFPGTTTINLGEHGYTKLLGAGDAPKGVTVTVEAAAKGAIEKLQASGGKVTTSRPKHVPKPPKAAAGGKGAAAPAKAPAAPAKAPAAPKPPAPAKPKA